VGLLQSEDDRHQWASLPKISAQVHETEPRIPEQTTICKIDDIPVWIKAMSDLLSRITVNPKQCGGRPCIRGMRIRVSDVLDLFVAGLSAEQILEEMPDLEADDLKAALLYASRKLDHPVLVA
jgi:uncharacterized protein (DUF433 family)